MSKREMHPNSLRAIQQATEKRSKPTGKRVNVFLTAEAINRLDELTEQLAVKSRSELIEKLSRLSAEELTKLIEDE